MLFGRVEGSINFVAFSAMVCLLLPNPETIVLFRLKARNDIPGWEIFVEDVATIFRGTIRRVTTMNVVIKDVAW